MNSLFGGKSTETIERMIEEDDPELPAHLKKHRYKKRVRSTRQLRKLTLEFGEGPPDLPVADGGGRT